jgi:hypothetical protein
MPVGLGRGRFISWNRILPVVVGRVSWHSPNLSSFSNVCVLILSWYKRSELGFRIAIFFSAATLAGAFGAYNSFCPKENGLTAPNNDIPSGGLLAAALHNMNGVAGRPGWAWIFIVEGSLTIVVACISPWIIQDFPETAKFLTETERTCTFTPASA